MVNRILRATLAASVLATGGAALGCRDQTAVPAAEMQAQTPAQQTNQPTTVTGCLKAGESADTFVLTVAKSGNVEQTATYHLVAGQGVNLSEHIGEHVEVSGVIKAQQEVATRSTTQPAGRPTGTGGTPAVSTQTDLEIKRLEVSSVREVEGRCET